MAATVSGALAFIPEPCDHRALVEYIEQTLQAARGSEPCRAASELRYVDLSEFWRGAGC